ncbi:MAG: hypothetical protein LBR14_04745 [Clostridiales Family XIII bacterium]|jgi:hypothetical protein|nr:hypothetical protein [Clostridiales Family XIII bacterium]
MGLFGRGKKQGTQPFLYNGGVPSPVYLDLMSRYLGPAVQHQRTFGKEIEGTERWFVDFKDGTIVFDERRFPVQFIGSESTVTNTWLWGTENVSGMPDSVLTTVNQFYNSFILNNVPDLAQPKLALCEAVSGHIIAMIMAAMATPPYCYYRCPVSTGAAFVLVGGIPEHVFAPIGLEETVEVISDLLEKYALDHRTLSRTMLEKNAVSVETGGAPGEDKLTGTYADGRTLEIWFDADGHILNLAFIPQM